MHNIREDTPMSLRTLFCRLILLSSPFYTGCAHSPMPPSTAEITVLESRKLVDEQPVTVTNKIIPFQQGTLYDLLVADIALMREQYDLALSRYRDQARKTRDEAVTEMAFGIARHIQDAQASFEMASLWLEISPDSHHARRAILQSYALLDNAIDALPLATWLFNKEGDDGVFLAVTAIAEGRKDEQIDALINAYRTVELEPKKKVMSDLAIAMLLRESNQLEQAEAVAREFIRQKPDDLRGKLILAQILDQQDRDEDAIDVLKQALKQFPDSDKVRLQYARLLTLVDRSAALIEFEVLHLSDPQSPEVSFLLALLYLDQAMLGKAQALFLQLIRHSRFANDAHYYLGNIADKRGDVGAAMSFYTHVLGGNNFYASVTRALVLLLENDNLEAALSHLEYLRNSAPKHRSELFELEANLLINNGRAEQALVSLTTGLQSYPDDQNLLYARAMLLEQQGKFERAEADLRAIIARDENNAAAINALGYTMVLHTERLDEAYDLIQRAYALKPQSPAIIDSMGWVLFKRGNLEEALTLLKRAMAMMPDPEIAAHLGEIHWVMGNREMALKTWQKGLVRAPDHEQILTTMHRLGVTPRTSESSL